MKDQKNQKAAILRQLAEELLKKKSLPNDALFSDIDILKLVHELDVHQVELEMQNEELILAKTKDDALAEKYINLYDFAPSGYFTLSKEGEIIELNFNGANLLGKERALLLNKRFALFVNDATRPTFNVFIDDLFETKTNQTCELILNSVSNIPTYVYLTGRVIEDENKCLITVVDISNQKKAEVALQKSQEKLEGIFNVANSGIFLVDKFGNFLMFNDWFCKSLGYTRNEFQQLNVQAVSHPEDLEKSIALNQKIIDCEIEKYQIEKRYIRKDKSILWCEVFASAIKDQDDNVVNIIKLVYDISDKIVNRMALEKSEARLIEAQAIAKVGSWETNLSYSEANWSKETEEIFGINPKNTPNPIEAILAIIHPEDRLEVETVFIHSIKKNTLNLFEHRIITPTGIEKIIEQRWKIERDSKGQPLFAIGTCQDITERKLAEALILQSKTRFSSIINSSPIALAISDEHLNITYLNPAFVAVFGYILEEMSTLDDWLPKAYPEPQYREKIANYWIKEFEKVKQTGKEFIPIEAIIRCKNGSNKTVLVSANPLLNSNNSEYLINFYDITERKQAEQALEKEKLRLAVILIGTGAGTWEWNIKTGETIFNERWATLIGYTLEELAPISVETWKKFTHPDDLKLSEEILANHFQGHLDYYECEFRMKHKNGDWVWVLDRGKINEWDIEGKPFYMSGTHQDITERKQAEEKIQENKKILRAVLDNAPIGIWMTNEDGRLIFVNESFCNSVGISEEQFVNANHYADLYDPEISAACKASDQEAFAKEEPHISYEKILFTDGKIHDLETIKRKIIDKNSDIPKLIGIAQDITERKLAEEKLIASEKFLNQTQSIANLGSYTLDFTTGKWTSTGVLDNIFGIDAHFERTIEAWSSIVHPDWWKIMNDYLNDEVICKKNDFNKDYKIIKIDSKEERWVHGVGEITFDNEGQPKLLIGSIQDITERKIIEEKLKLSSEKFHDLVNSTGGIVWEADGQKFNFTYVSNQAERLLGYSTNEWLEEGFWINHLHPEDKDQAITYCVSQTKRMASHDFTYRFICKNGSTMWLRDIVNVVVEDGKPRWLRGVMFDVTNLKETNLLLSESEEKYRGLVENAPYGIIIYVEEKIAFVNAEVLNIFHVNEKEEVIGKSVLEFVHPDSVADISQRMKEVLRDSNASATIEAKFITLDGIPFEAEIKAIPTIYDHQLAVQVIIQDISRQKQTALDLNKINRVYALISQINNLIIRTHNREELFQEICNIAVNYGKFRMSWIGLLNEDNIFISAAFAGYEKGYFTKRNVTTIDDVPEGRGPTGIATREERTVICNDIANDEIMKPWRKDALERGYNSLISIPIIVRNKTIGAFNLYSDEKNFFSSEEEISLLEKITLNIAFALETILTEEERKQTDQKIRQLSRAVEQSPVSIIITTIDGEIEYANPKFVENTGYTLEEIIGQNPRILKSGHTSDEEYQELWKTITSGKEWHGEFKNRRKDGTLFWESATISPILNSQGITTHFIAIKEDITERKNAEQELINAKLQAEESDRLKLVFLANMSHEIRTPMNGILGFTELLKLPHLSGEEQQEYISIIEKSGKRMLNIINDIISISKVESGQMEISLSKTDINEQLNYIQTFFKPEAKQKGIQLYITKELPSKYKFIETDKEKIYAILTNLVKNAIKFTNEGTIEFGCEIKGEYLECFVIDSGIGISNSQKSIVFERFRQANESISRSHEGSGLGLAISKAYIEMLGGKIWVESEVGKGSAFYFTIPFIAEEKEEIVVEKVHVTIEPENKIKDLKVLIVEDDAISKLLITIAIKPYCKEVLKVTNGIEAIATCRNNTDIDLVMMDINMPEMGGYEATKLIREFNKDLIIIAQTANGMQSDREAAIEAGCTDYISKPINIKDLGALIQKYFKK